MQISKRPSKWRDGVQAAFSGIRLRGLRSVCPVCGEIGLITTKWVKGPALKPVCIIHMYRGQLRRLCELEEGEASKVRGKVSICEGDIRRLIKTRSPFVLFSGGKDSLATLIYLKKIAKQVRRRLTAVYVDTTAGLPENTEYVKNVCKYMRVRLQIVRPKVDYFTLAKKWGIPSFRYRWCCRELKIKPIEEFFRGIKKPIVVFDGIRAVESNVRSHYVPIWYHPSFRCLSVSPIFYWTDENVFSVINNNGIPKTLLHSLGTSTECWCGAYKTANDFAKLYELNKDMFNKLVEIEVHSKNRYTFIYKKGEKIPLKQLERQILTSLEREK